ncbi:hypothetical protein [Roseovarius ramblicola]|uniref:PRC-barrel domain-containing protein n=1 Tax=Roseovarius ramblicola TaxID=2022336 RepID=A0ABV5I4J3_9RHOB
MKLRTIATALLLSTGLATIGHAQSVGVGTDGSAGVGVGGSTDGNVGVSAGTSGTANLGIDGDSSGSGDVGADTSGRARLGTALGLAGKDAAEITGATVVSADGQVIGTVQGARTDPADGSVQALVSLDESAGMSVETLAFEAASLKAESEDTLVNAMTVAELRRNVEAQASGNARAATLND